jgi:hypothetical protein
LAVFIGIRQWRFAELSQLCRSAPCGDALARRTGLGNQSASSSGNSMKRVWVLAVVLPTFAYGATGAAFLARVPGLPANAQAAYAMWNDRNGDLTIGAPFKALEADLQKTMTTGMPGQDAGAPQMGAAAVSPGDIALTKQIQFYPATVQIMQKTVAIQNASAALQAQWDKDAAALATAEAAERARLAVCHGEAGEPSDLAVKSVALNYAGKAIALADSYLPKFIGLAVQYRQTIAPEVAYGDNAAASWQKISNPGLKAQTVVLARGAESSALNDVARYLAFVEGISKKAARTVAGREGVERLYANAKGC